MVPLLPVWLHLPHCWLKGQGKTVTATVWVPSTSHLAGTWGLAYSFRSLAYYHHGEKREDMKANMVLERTESPTS